MAEAFELTIDYRDFREGQYDAVLAELPNQADLWWLASVPLEYADAPTGLPSEFWFWGSIDRVKQLDFLYTDVGWAVCSRSMLECLRDVGDFDHLAIPAHFRESRSDLNGTLEGEVFVLVTTKTTDVLNRAASDILRDEDGSVLQIRRWSFSNPPGGLPPLFRLPEQDGILLVSREAKDALESSGLNGFEITSQDQIGSISSPHPSVQ